MIYYVYVAGPISKGDVFANIRLGIDTGAELRKLGFAPFVPHYDYPAYMWRNDVWDYETVLANDFDWIMKCDAILRLPGESAGADREVAFANEQKIPVYFSVSDLLDARDEANDRYN